MPLTSFLRTNQRLLIGLGCYAVLIAIALYALLPVRTSNERFILGFVLFFFAILIVKTIIHSATDREAD